GPWGPELVLVDEGRGDGEVSVPEDDLVGFHESGGLEWNAGDSGDVLVFVDAGTVQAGVRPAQALKELIGRVLADLGGGVADGVVLGVLFCPRGEGGRDFGQYVQALLIIGDRARQGADL